MIDDTTKEFINRHIGPSKADQKKILEYIGSNSLEELIKDTVPKNILLKDNLKKIRSSEALLVWDTIIVSLLMWCLEIC